MGAVFGQKEVGILNIRKHTVTNKSISEEVTAMSNQARTLNAAELEKLLRVASNTKHPERNRVILLLTHLAGMRVGEVAAVKIGDVVLNDKRVLDQINLKASQTKGSQSRTVLLNERMQAELASYVKTLKNLHPANPLFPTQRSIGFSANSLTQIVNGLYRKAGLHGCSSHSGRRGFLTNLAEKGVSVRVMMALAGHRNMATTQRYIDLRPGVLRNAVELI